MDSSVRGVAVCRALGAGVIALVGFALVPAVADAWTVEVRIHGAGTVSEVENRTGGTRHQTGCTVSPAGRSETAPPVTCTMGTSDGFWNSLDVVRLSPSVSPGAAARGWRFKKWVDGSASGQVNCDPQDTLGDHTSPDYCEFQVFQNLYVDLYFEDVQGPQDTFIIGAPAFYTRGGSLRFQFSSTDFDADFECKVTGPQGARDWFPCGTSGNAEILPVTTEGHYTFYVRAKDPSGNLDVTPASRSFVVDRTSPDVSITEGPTGSTKQTSALFAFGANESSSFRCALQTPADPTGSLTACTSPWSLTDLGEGSHTFSVMATDQAGNESAATRTWTVDTTPPKIAFAKKPKKKIRLKRRSRAAKVAFKFKARGEAGVGFKCKLDRRRFRPCKSPQRFKVRAGGHTFKVAGVDAAGNQGKAAYRFRVIKRR